MEKKYEKSPLLGMPFTGYYRVGKAMQQAVFCIF